MKSQLLNNKLFVVLLVLATPAVFAQSDIASQEVTDFGEFVTQADSLLEVNTVFPLAGMAITAASFLFHRSKNDDDNKKHLVYAKEIFIKAFFGLII